MPGMTHCGDIAAIHLDALVANHVLVEWRRIAIEVPALDAKAALQSFYDGRFVMNAYSSDPTQRLVCTNARMREIAQVVDDQQIVRVIVKVRRDAFPIRIAQVGKIDDQARGPLLRYRPSRPI